MEKDKMNRVIPRIGSAIVTAAVILFAICLITDFLFGSYFVCMFLPIGYIMMAAGLHNESDKNRRVAANTGMAFAVVYAVLIFLVYFAQTTSIRFGGLSEQAQDILDNATIEANNMRAAAIQYTDEMLANLENLMMQTVNMTASHYESFINNLNGYAEIIRTNRADLHPQETDLLLGGAGDGDGGESLNLDLLK